MRASVSAATGRGAYQVMTRYYGWYANQPRGTRRMATAAAEDRTAGKPPDPLLTAVR